MLSGMQEAGPNGLPGEFSSDTVWDHEAMLKVGPRPGFESYLCHSLPGEIGASLFTSRTHSLLDYHMGMVTS